jgi:hypothetical protein
VAGAVSIAKKRALQGAAQGGDACTAGTVAEVAAAAHAGVPHAKAVEGHVLRDTSAETGSAKSKENNSIPGKLIHQPHTENWLGCPPKKKANVPPPPLRVLAAARETPKA